MPSERRPREFLFEPARFKNDLAVMRMSPAARGLFAMLFCEGWDMPEVGVLPDDDALLSTLARTDQDTWSELRAEVATAYDTVSRPGFWIQKGTVATYESQKLWLDGKIEAGRRGGIESGKVRRSAASTSGSTRLRSKRSGRVGVGRVGLGGVGVGGVLTEKRSEKDFDPTPVSSSGNGHVQTVRTRTFRTDPGPKFWNSPEVQAKLERLRIVGVEGDDARNLILASEKSGT